MDNTDALAIAYVRALGKVLKAHRHGTHRSRKAFVSERVPDVGIQAYRSWELGERNMPVSKLPLVASALGTTPHALLAEVDRALLGDTTVVDITVDLVKLADVEVPELASVARWARTVVNGGRCTVRLSTDEIGRLAGLVDMPPTDLTVVLADVAVASAA
jgi:hypothetical protein